MEWVKKLWKRGSVQQTKYKTEKFRERNFWCLYINSKKSIQHRQIKFREKMGDDKTKIPDISVLASIAVLNTKVGEIENIIPDVSGLVTTAVVNTNIDEVENKISDVSKLVKKQAMPLI